MNVKLLGKAAVLGGIVFLLFIALMLIEATISERSSYQREAKASVSQSWTGSQNVVLPVLVVPYQQRIVENRVNPTNQQTVRHVRQVNKVALYPLRRVQAEVTLKSDTLKRGIFEIPVYRSHIQLTGHLELEDYRALQQRDDVGFQQKPFVSVGLSDQRGLVGTPEVKIAGVTQAALPGTNSSFRKQGFWFPLSELKTDAAVDIAFYLNGMEQVTFTPTAKSTELALTSDWPHPSFVGAFLPEEREVSSQGYAAKWRTSYFSSSVTQALHSCALGNCGDFNRLDFGVKQILPVNHYSKSKRSTKYGLLMVLLTFAAFLIFEAGKGRLLHPVQYMLVGLAIIIFYLLLAALSEHMSFTAAYMIASVACTALIGVYMIYQLGLRQTLSLIAGLTSLYWVLFMIILSEDYAFLSGAILSFVSLGLMMIATRKIQWSSFGKSKRLNEE